MCVFTMTDVKRILSRFSALRARSVVALTRTFMIDLLLGSTYTRIYLPNYRYFIYVRFV